MTIDIDEFENKDEDELEGPTNAQQVLSFLRKNDDKAFQPGTIAENTGVNPNSISAVLNRLEERGLVRHKASYWAITDDANRLQSFSGYETATEALNEQLGEEDPDEWAEHAAGSKE